MIETSRLRMRDWREEDIPTFAAMCADPIVMKHFPALLSYADAEAQARRIRVELERNGWGLWAVEVKDGAPFIGFVGLSQPKWRADVDNTALPFGSATSPGQARLVEVGWRLMPTAWGHGYATEAARAALDHGFHEQGLDEIVAFTVPANVPSQRVMERLGMVRDPSADFEHPNIPVGNPLRLHWLWRIRTPRRT
jgi:RimJ/RimL family protein N-acetyltransferase